MRKSHASFLRQLTLGIGLALPLSAFASPGYWVNSYGETWHTSYNKCWRTSAWTAQDATAECDAELMPKPAPVAKVEPPPPPPPPPAPKMITLNETASGKANMGFDKYAVTPDQAELLKTQLAGVKNAQIRSVAVRGYTDRIGPRAYNQKLSEKRANAVAKFIQQHFAISGDKIHSIGMGPADPVVQCKGVRGAALIKCLGPNRRVTVEVDIVRTKMMPAEPSSN